MSIKNWDWYKAHKGDYKHLPGSEGQGVRAVQEKLIPLHAQIAIFFGSPAGSLEDLREGVIKLATGQKVSCQACKRDIFKEKHRADCAIAIQYKEVTTTPATPRINPNRTRKDDLKREERGKRLAAKLEASGKSNAVSNHSDASAD